ncbi:MAG: hypothetical protein MUP67_03000 [Acidimicrobiia bacterium]|nr:hypothetical protein [Acidimicrobiia bacterium]
MAERSSTNKAPTKDASNKTASSKTVPSGLIKNRWVATAVSLLIGIGLGTTVGRSVLDTAGVPASCVKTIQRADTALATGTAVADNGKAALAAVKGLRIGEAGDLLGQVKDDAARFVTQAKRFNTLRQQCKADRK